METETEIFYQVVRNNYMSYECDPTLIFAIGQEIESKDPIYFYTKNKIIPHVRDDSDIVVYVRSRETRQTIPPGTFESHKITVVDFKPFKCFLNEVLSIEDLIETSSIGEFFHLLNLETVDKLLELSKRNVDVIKTFPGPRFRNYVCRKSGHHGSDTRIFNDGVLCIHCGFII